MTLHVVMIMRNEMGRYLTRALKSGQDVARAGGGKLIVTDDASEDYTATIAERYADSVQHTLDPLFWKHEGQARQRHLDYAGRFFQDGDWVLSLDADETISDPERLAAVVASLPPRHEALGLPLYEFWTRDMYRTDGKWFGTQASRVFRWHPGGLIADKPMGCGSEPTYVQDAIAQNLWTRQTDVHLLHWGYCDPKDRERKYQLYTSRLGGHGHHSAHIQSIVTQPQLRKYG